MLKKIVKSTAIFIIAAIILLSGLYYHFFVSMSTLPDGDLIGEYEYTNSGKKVNVYLCNAGATSDYAIKADFIDENNKTKTIYWAYHENDAEVKWIDTETVIINGKKLNVHNDTYDWRRSD